MLAVHSLRRHVKPAFANRLPPREVVANRQNRADDDERTRRRRRQQEVGRPRRDDLHLEDRPGAEKLPDRAEHRQRQRESEPHPGTVENRAQRPVLRRERLGPAEHDAVHHDQRNEDPERRVQRRRRIGLHQQVDDRHEGRNHHDVDRDADLLRHDSADEGDHQIAPRQHEGGRDPHADAVGGAAGHRERRAGAEQQNQHRVLLPDSLGKILEQTHFSFPPAFSSSARISAPSSR